MFSPKVYLDREMTRDALFQARQELRSPGSRVCVFLHSELPTVALRNRIFST